MNALDVKPAPHGALQFSKVIVAVDLSSDSEATVGYAAAFAKAVGASMNLVYVYPLDPINAFVVDPDVFTAPERQRKAAQKALANLARGVRETCPQCDETLLVGHPAKEVACLARTLMADLIVIGDHHPGFLGWWFGLDQGSKIVHRAPCPVLVYHEEGYAAQD